MKRWILLLFCFSVFQLNADVTFGGLNLSESDHLLFHADAEGPVYGNFRTLFRADIPGRSIKQLTFFPEKVTLLNDGSRLQIQNRFGIFRSEEDFGALKAVEEFSAFESGSEIQSGKISNVEASPDGLYLLYYRPVSYAYADLVLFSVEDQTETVISRKNEFSLDNPAASWSPDSRYFVYARQGSLYYFSVDQFEEDRMIAEDFRSIGEGGISSVHWSSRNDLYYINQYRVYKIHSAEFFTQSIYSGLFGIGTIIGKVPFDFDSNFDSFNISPDGKKILLNRGGRNLFLYYLKTDDYRSTGEIKSLPYLFLPRNTSIKRVLWSEDDIITILSRSILDGGIKSSVFRINLVDQADSLSFVQTADTDVLDIVLSPDETTAALMKSDGIVLMDYSAWTYRTRYSHTSPYSVMWRDDSEFIIAGSMKIELVNRESGEHRLIALSQSENFGFGKDGAVYAFADGESYVLTEGDSWKEAADPALAPARVASMNKRVYLESSTFGSYSNIVMVRDIKGYGTKPLFPLPSRMYEPFPAKEEESDFSNFTHGSRIRRREVSLVFNAIDSVEGLTEILNILADYSIRGTFFINGEFMRRNPEAVKELSVSGHEIGSLFYIYFNMTDARFKLDENFIKRGLARNEDDYFLLTGKELSLLWHSPFYFVNSDIIKASESMDYTYVGRDLDPMDWVPSSDCESEFIYSPATDIVENIMKSKKPGSIIPIRIGQMEEGRDDYLFQNLDLLINGLMSQGYEIVPVTTLMEHAR